MTRSLIRLTTVSLLVSLVPAGSAPAATSPPDPANSTVPACITLVGSNGARTFANAARVCGNGFLIASPSVSTFDADGDAGVGANDLSLWLADFGTGLTYARGDYDCSGGLGANDLSVWLGAFGAGTQTASCAVSCP
jgi:hypothetical protein